ncbi:MULTISPECIES: hypothetical protein [Peribacillus]|nr:MULTISPECIES: hypothetical protein [Peribacillus]MBD8591633.1 hypothetical protein [Peribacillus simplex]MCM3169598.1 hypothetical protein [Peribacillus frigoritolerans]MEE3955733.1 hypothetical protein [Peribacillus frigoritolerans]
MFKKVTNKIKNSVLQNGTGNFSIFKSKNVTVNQIQAMDQMQLYIQNGEIDNAAALLRQMNDFINSQHPCAPFWKYEFGIDENGRTYKGHAPAFPGAEKLKPLTGTMKIVIPSNYKKFKNMKELLNFSYGSQQEIEFDLKSLKTWIGETLIDEFEANENSGNRIKFIPSKFPPPLPMKLYLKDHSWSIDYLLIGVEKMVDSTISLSNHQQQEASMAVELIMDISLSTARFNITITDHGLSSVKNILKFHDLIDKSKKANKPKLALKLLENDTDVIIGPNWDFNNNGNPDTEEFINFLKKINYIEQEFNIEFMLPNRRLTNWELDTIDLIYNSLKVDHLKLNFKNSYIFTLNNQLEIQKLFKLHDKDSCLNVHLDLHSIEQHFDLLGIKFKPVTNTAFLENVKLDKPEKLRMKSTLLDDGEQLNVKLLPYNSESFISQRLLVEPV